MLLVQNVLKDPGDKIVKQQKGEYYQSNLKMIFALNIEIVIYMLYIISVDSNGLKTCQEIAL